MRTSSFIPSFNASLILIFHLPGEIPSEVDPPIFVGFSVKSIISLLSLQTYTSAILSTSQQLCFWLETVKIPYCQLSISGIVLFFVFVLALKFFSELCICI